MPMNVCDLMNSEGNWDMNVIRKYIDNSSHNSINSVVINLCLHDRIRWKSTISGNLTTKSVYNFLTNLTIDKDEERFWKQIWNLNILPKVNMFCWKVVSNALALGKNMSKYVKDYKPYCLLCNSHDIKDEMHLNSVQFDKAVPNVHKLIDLVKVSHQKFNIPRHNKTSHDSVTDKKLQNDNPTNGRCTYDWFIHFDASFLEDDFSMGYTISILDKTGDRKHCRAGCSWDSFPLEAETKA
ncbi:uncharacterized protein LOC113272850 [Papaver somniferum]|uniref:uncharacterized protein LOC113272850 n=1 Tax=Papaver somniferum TaxID=3469 RepID=UPI000E7001C6|nr:uncharacterized protein LOC113272850 [Papaver somniferum]